MNVVSVLCIHECIVQSLTVKDFNMWYFRAWCSSCYIFMSCHRSKTDRSDTQEQVYHEPFVASDQTVPEVRSLTTRSCLKLRNVKWIVVAILLLNKFEEVKRFAAFFLLLVLKRLWCQKGDVTLHTVLVLLGISTMRSACVSWPEFNAVWCQCEIFLRQDEQTSLRQQQSCHDQGTKGASWVCAASQQPRRWKYTGNKMLHLFFPKIDAYI